MKLYHNLFCTDIDAQLRFYCALLGVEEAAHLRSPIYRGVELPGLQFGFHAPAAYGLLRLDDRAPPTPVGAPVTGYATFMLDTPAAVDAACARADALGGRVRKPPYATYYGQWQAVLADPEDHVFRLSCEGLPDGTRPAVLALPEAP